MVITTCCVVVVGSTNTCSKQHTGMINTTKIVLSAPLPRVYQDAGNGKAQPVVPGNRPPGLIGGEFNAEELGRVSKETVRWVRGVVGVQ